MKTILPREKLHLWGPESLSDNELIQTLLGTGTHTVGLPELAQRCLRALETDPLDGALERLRSIPGMGGAKTARVLSALELARRYSVPPHTRVKTPGDVYVRIRHFAQRTQETFLVVALNGACEIVQIRRVSSGILNRTLVHPREVFAPAIEQRAAQIVLAHNHPSGNLEPSAEDREVTRRLVEAGRLLGIEVLDHLIFSDETYLSLRESDEMPR